MSSKLYRSGGTPCLAAKSIKAANGVRHSSAARPSETLSSRVKFERQQSSDFLGEAALLQICDSHKFGWQLYVHGFDTGKLPHPQHFVMPCRLPFAHAALKGLTRTCQTSDHQVAVTRWDERAGLRGMRYAPNVRRAQGTMKRRPAMKKTSTVRVNGNMIFKGHKLT